MMHLTREQIKGILGYFLQLCALDYLVHFWPFSSDFYVYICKN